MPCRVQYLLLLLVLATSPPALAQDTASATSSTTELKSDSLASRDSDPSPKSSPEKSSTILASSLLGQTLYGRDGQRIGQISDIVMTRELNGVLAIVGIGGFLGLGVRDVAIPKDKIAVSQNMTGELRFTAASTREQLQQAPTFNRTALIN